MATIDNQLDPSATGSFSIAEILQRLEGPLETVRGMPNEVFTSAAFHALECEKLFTPHLGVCRAFELGAQSR